MNASTSTLMLIRYEVSPSATQEVSDAARATFDALARIKPPGMKFTYARAGAEFIGLLEFDGANPLEKIPEALALKALVAKHAPNARPQPLELLGRY